MLDYQGTLLLVSHDRAFLNNVVTSTLVLEGDGRIGEYVGGYDDWLRQRPEPSAGQSDRSADASGEQTASAGQTASAQQTASIEPPSTSARPRKLTYKEQRELETLPARIEALETEQGRLYHDMADPTLYQQGGDEVVKATARLAELERELANAYARWEELEARAPASGGRCQNR